MFLKKIELYGFKSFADKTVLELMPGITTVIGPNGSGKSNVVDAVRWVLGEQSMKSLRGSKSEDVIFSGTQARKSVGFAEISLYIDNSTGILPIEYNEVVVTRRLYRSGESQYQINKTDCRLKDIQQLFLNTGVGKDGYSIISQGKVEEILSSKSEDRRHIFEEAAGILKYKYRKEEAEKKLASTRDNLARVTDIVNEIENNIENLKHQSEKAKKFLVIRDELKEKEINLFSFNMSKNNNALNDFKDKVDIATEQLNAQEIELSNIQILKQDSKNEIEAILMKQEEMQKDLYESDNNIERLNSEINILSLQINNNLENISAFDNEFLELNETINRNKEEKENKASKIEMLLNNRKKFELELKEKEEQYNVIYSKLNDSGELAEKNKLEIEDIHEKRNVLKLENNTLISNIAKDQETYTKLEKELSEYAYLKDSKRIKREDFDSILSELQKQVKAYDEIIASYEIAKKNIDEKTVEYDNKIENLLREISAKTSRSNFLKDIQKEHEGYARAVKEILVKRDKDTTFSQGIHGSVADLIYVEPKFEVALEMALGAYLQNIVTEDEHIAQKCIDFLKQNNFGRASFLPITKIKGNRNDNEKSLQSENGFLGFACDLIKYDSKYENIVLNLLGKTLIVDTLQNAIALSKKTGTKYKIVTEQGDIISTFGQMTGGSVNKKTANILGRNKEIEMLDAEVKKYEKEIIVQKQMKEKLTSEQLDLQSYQTASIKINELNIEIATNKQIVNQIDSEIETMNRRIEQIGLELEKIAEVKVSSTNAIEINDKKLFEFEGRVAVLQETIEKYANEFKDEQKNIDTLKDEITDLKISISSFDESNLSYEEVIDLIEKEIEKSEALLLRKITQKEKMLEQNVEFNSKIQEIKDSIEKIALNKDEFYKNILEVKKEKDEKNVLLEKYDKDIENILNTISLLKDEISKLEMKKTKIESDIEGLLARMLEEYELTPEQIPELSVEILEPQKVVKEIDVLKKQIKELGSINIDSIEEYRQNKERCDFLTAQKLDLEGSEDKLKKLISEMTVVMKEQFRTKFKIINEHFGVTFTQLFGGGRAEIRLTDENDILNCGVEIEVQPPGKKLQNMLLLSGGEKALTAIALLFGILTTNPSPFCILDEIEAALDDINVYRFAQYVKNYVETTQFLIITHRKGTMEIADTIYGVTMQEQGISKLISMKLK